MPVSATCPGCGKRLSGPDSAAGHKARCPQCGQVVQFPSAGGAAAPGARPSPANALAEALAQASAEPAAPPAAAEPAAAEPAAKETPSGATPTPGRDGSVSRHSTTTVSRMVARASPYQTLRLLGVIIYGVGIAVAALVFLGGLAALIFMASAGTPGLAVAVFVGALIAAALVFLLGKTAGELIRLWADVGDRARHIAQMFEDSFLRNRHDVE